MGDTWVHALSVTWPKLNQSKRQTALSVARFLSREHEVTSHIFEPFGFRNTAHKFIASERKSVWNKCSVIKIL